MASALDNGFADCVADAGRPRDGMIDRFIFVGTALLIIAVVLAGFIPSSLNLLERVGAGERTIAPVLHLHAILMGAWLVLLLLQSSLMATGRPQLHMRLGVVSLALVPAMVITGFALVPTSIAEVRGRIAAMPPEQAAEVGGFLLPLLNNIMLAQIAAGISFPLLVGLALYYRFRRPQTHKRLMIFATTMPLAAATDRLAFVPSSLPDSPLTMILWPSLVLVPLLVWDLSRRQKLDVAWLIYLLVMVLKWVPVWLLWGSEWWAITGPRLIGAD